MITPHFGNFELMGFVIAKLGFPMTAIMRPLDNVLLTSYIERSREAGGLTLIYKVGAAEEAGATLDDGGTVCIIADQDAGSKGVFADYFNRPAAWYKSIGLIVVGQMVRARQGFHYRMEVERIIRPEEWESRDDSLRWITAEFANAFERAIRRHPEQYLWAHRRWKSQPGQRLSRRSVGPPSPTDPGWKTGATER